MFLTGCHDSAGEAGTEFLAWLGSSVDQANQAASEHEALKAEIRALKEILEGTFLLRAVHVRSRLQAFIMQNCSVLAGQGGLNWMNVPTLAIGGIGGCIVSLYGM